MPQRPLTPEQINALQRAAEQVCKDNQRVMDLIRETMEATGLTEAEARLCLEAVEYIKSAESAKKIRDRQRTSRTPR